MELHTVEEIKSSIKAGKHVRNSLRQNYEGEAPCQLDAIL